MIASPLWLETFLLDYHMGHAMVLAFLLTIGAVIPLKSKRVLTLTVLLFGVIFFLLPSQEVPEIYRFFGIALVVITPIIWTTLD